MKANKIISKLNIQKNKAVLQLKKHSPEIAMVVGITCGLIGVVKACKASVKAHGVVENFHKDMADIAADLETLGNEYTEEDAKVDTVEVYKSTGMTLAKLYAPAVGLGVISISLIVKSNDILKKRNAALATAYVTLDRGFRDYRGRVIERFGEKIDKELKYNVKSEILERTTVDADGKEHTESETVEVVSDIDKISPYAKFFDEGSPYWEKDAEYNLMFLRSQQQYATDRLRAQGFLFLNDVYDSLGIPKTSTGQKVGWIYDKENPIGDNYIDFGIYDTNVERRMDFVNGYERCILLDFNVDGSIIDLI